MRTSMRHQMTRVGGPVRRGAIVLALTGLVVTLGAGIGDAQSDPADGRAPGAAPGAVSDAAPAPIATTDGRRGGAVADSSLARSAGSSQTPAVTDNGRGGPDPAVGPNPVPADVARSASAAERGVDSDSGAAPVPDASTAASAPQAPADEDVPGAAAATPAGDADSARSVANEAPVDRD